VFPAVAWFGRVDAEGLLKAPPPQGGDDYGAAALLKIMARIFADVKSSDEVITMLAQP
jgi:hypothetical protein